MATRNKAVSTPVELDKVASGRDHIFTPEFALAVGCSEQTARKNHCLQGECYGIRPVKVGSRLLWPVVQIAALLNGGLQA